MRLLIFSLLGFVFAVQYSNQFHLHREVKLTTSEARLANQLHDVTKKYLDEKVSFFSKGGKPFSRFEVLGVEETNGIIHEYVWYNFNEYIVEDGQLVIGSGGSAPVALTIKRDGNSFKVESYKESNFYGELDMFPKRLHSMLKEYVAPNEWGAEIKEDAKQYYNLH